MKIKYADSYNKNGCNFTGNLAIVEYFDEVDSRSSKKLLGGFGSMTTFDVLDEARELIKSTHGDKYKELLSIPDLVVELPSTKYPI